MITPRAFASLARELRSTIRRYRAGRCPYGVPTFFELITALAFLHFRNKKVGCAVIETGMGGRLDATNTVRPLVCVITPISFDHVDILGKTLGRIAREKAGIIKGRGGLSVVCSPQMRGARGVIRARCARTRSRFIPAGTGVKVNARTGTFSVTAGTRTYSGLKITLAGRHQVSNAATAVAAAEQLRLRGFKITRASVRGGLLNALWPARCEVLGRRPLVIIDGCQNRASALALRAAVREQYRFQRLILVFGMSSDKDLEGTSRALAGIADEVILTRACHPRASDTRRLECFFKGKTVYHSRSVAEAKRKARVIARPGDLILACGSLFVAGEFKYGRPARA